MLWTSDAMESLVDLLEYLVPRSERAAARIVSELLDEGDRLAMFPSLGHPAPEFGVDSIRELIVYPYRLLYRRGNDLVEILAVLHGARDLRP